MRSLSPMISCITTRFKSDRQSLLEAMDESASHEPNKALHVKQIIAEGDRVAVISEVIRADADVRFAVVHILKFREDMIAEMWDMGQEIPPDSPNELGMF